FRLIVINLDPQAHYSLVVGKTNATKVIFDKDWLFGLCYAMDGVIRDETFIEKGIWRFLSTVFDLERTNQLNLLPTR
ncbi:MAG: hypothetical protein ACKO90_36165, partial [Microcystis panniformis]